MALRAVANKAATLDDRQAVEPVASPPPAAQFTAATGPAVARLSLAQRQEFAMHLQRTVGNAAMGGLAAPLSRVAANAGPTIQRCACGGTPGADGECEQCKRRRVEGEAAELARSAAPTSAASPATRSSKRMLARYSDDPIRAAALALAREIGLPGEFYVFLNCVLRPGIASGISAVYQFVRLLHAFATATPARQNELMGELINSSMPIIGHVNAFCNCVPPTIISGMARDELVPYPDAVANFDHYLHGGGADRPNDIGRMLAEDQGDKKALETAINGQSELAGDLENPIGTDDHVTRNWQYALGGIDLIRFKVADDPAAREANAKAGDGTALVHVELRDPYEWHPDERRAHLCLHTGMENMKFHGAADFMATGAADVRLRLSKRLIPLPQPVPGQKAGAARAVYRRRNEKIPPLSEPT